MKRSKKTSQTVLIIFVLIILAGLFLFRTYSNPFAAIGEFFYERQDVDETVINVKGTAKGLLAQTEEKKFYLSSLGTDILYTTGEDSEEHLVEWGEVYQSGNMVFSWAIKTDNYLLALGQNYDPEVYGHEGPLKEGLLGRYNGAVLEFIDLKMGEVVKEYEFEEILLYANEEFYVAVKQEEIRFCEYGGNILKTDRFQDYEEGQEYTIVQTDEGLEFYKVTENGEQEHLQNIVLNE